MRAAALALATLSLLLSPGCGLLPKRVEYFQRKVEAVPEKRDATAEVEKQAATFIADVSGLKRVELVLRTTRGETRLPMRNHGPYPSQTGPLVTAHYCTAALPPGAGDARYYIEAEDQRGNTTRGALERIHLA